MRSLTAVSLLAILVVALSVATPALAASSQVTMLPPTVSVPDDLRAAVQQALDETPEFLPKAANAYIITGLDDLSQGFWFASVKGLVMNSRGDVIADAGWYSLVILQAGPAGVLAAVQGSLEFDEMIDLSPLRLEAKIDLAPRLRGRYDVGGETGKPVPFFPFTGGTSAKYGSLGVHSNSGGRMAVDFISWSAAGMSADQAYAAVGGTISYVCDDGVSVCLRIGDYGYCHLISPAEMHTGQTVGQTAYLGTLKHGTFDGPQCGGADQQADHWHVHWTFPDWAELQVEDWVLDTDTEDFTKTDDSKTVSPGEMIGPANWSCASCTDGPGGPGSGYVPPVATPLQANLWNDLIAFLLKMIMLIGKGEFVDHKTMNLAETIGAYATLPIKIVALFAVTKFQVAFILMLVVFIMEPIRAGIFFWMFIKRLIPFID
jgi:hypothetical protein